MLRVTAGTLLGVGGVNAEEWPPHALAAAKLHTINKAAENRLFKVGFAHAFSVRSIKQKDIDLLLTDFGKDSAQES